MAKKLASRENLVIATGGGVVLEPENIAILCPNSIIILLEARPQDIWARVNRKKGTRPLLKGVSCAEDIEKLLAAREKYYNCADIRINTSDKDLEFIIREIMLMLEEISNKNNN
jgi:shikimate kinase